MDLLPTPAAHPVELDKIYSLQLYTHLTQHISLASIVRTSLRHRAVSAIMVILYGCVAHRPPVALL